MEKQYYVYIMTNRIKSVLYTGVTNNLKRRVFEHKEGLGGKFSKRYSINRLVYYEITDSIESAMAREKQIKKGPRRKKEELINSMNREWVDLSEGL